MEHPADNAILELVDAGVTGFFAWAGQTDPLSLQKQADYRHYCRLNRIFLDRFLLSSPHYSCLCKIHRSPGAIQCDDCGAVTCNHVYKRETQGTYVYCPQCGKLCVNRHHNEPWHLACKLAAALAKHHCMLKTTDSHFEWKSSVLEACQILIEGLLAHDDRAPIDGFIDHIENELHGLDTATPRADCTTTPAEMEKALDDIPQIPGITLAFERSYIKARIKICGALNQQHFRQVYGHYLNADIEEVRQQVARFQ